MIKNWILKLAENTNNEEITQEMEDWFEKRLNNHISLVQKYAKKIEECYPEKFEGLIEQVENHDASKFEEPERTPYISISWRHKQDDYESYKTLGDLTKEDENQATLHHITHNKHHPECWCDREEDLLNEDDRDGIPDEIVDATDMPDKYIAELCSDWIAMGEELGNSAKDWADKNIGTRWDFTDEQQELIYELIDKVEEN